MNGPKTWACEGRLRRRHGGRYFGRELLVVCVVAGGLAMWALPGSGLAQEERSRPRYISIGGNPVGLAWYQMGAGLAEVLNRNMKGVNASVEATAGLFEITRRLREGTLEISQGYPDDAYESYTGTGRYRQASKYNILSMAGSQYGYGQMVVLKGSGILTFRDLRGKRIGLGPPGSASLVDARLALKAHGIDPAKDIRAFTTTLSESVELMKNGQLDAAMQSGTVPQAPLIDLAVTRGIAFVPFDEDALSSVLKEKPFYFASYLPSNTYPGQDRQVRTYSLRQFWVARDDLDEGLVYEVTRLMFENLDYLGKVHPGFREVSLEAVLKGLPIPLHPGAAKYFRERRVAGLDEFIEKTKNIPKR